MGDRKGLLPERLEVLEESMHEETDEENEAWEKEKNVRRGRKREA